MPTKQKTVRIVGIMALLCVAASSAHGKDTVFAQGIVMHSCAPYDGLSLEARIPTVSGHQVVLIQVNETLGAEPFSRPIAPRTRPGGASVHLCKREAADPKYPDIPQFSWDSCVEASSGSVDIGALIGSAMAGRLDVTYEDGKRTSAGFSARLWEPKGKFYWGCRGFRE
jgi:hypothetical protein